MKIAEKTSVNSGFDKIMECIISPMGWVFPPELPIEAAREYVDALKPFAKHGEPFLRSIWQEVRNRHKYRTKPTIAEFREVAFSLLEGKKTESGNGVVCNCGKHYGVGSWSPQKRAQSYARSRKSGISYNLEKQAFLDSYEAEHGPVILPDRSSSQRTV